MDSYVLVWFGMEVPSHLVTASCIDDGGTGYVARGCHYARIRRVSKTVILIEGMVFGRLYSY